MITPWRILGQSKVYSAPPFVEVSVEKVALPDGRVIDDYHHIKAGEFVSVIAETPEQRIIMLRQYRHGVRRIGLALPGGKLDPGETPEIAARRELLEEVGATAGDWRYMSSWATSCTYGFSTSHYFHAVGVTRVRAPAGDDLEEAELVELTRAEIRAAMRNGEILSLGHAAPLAFLLLEEAAPAISVSGQTAQPRD
ncbi:MAG TPA: NUDIX hydrolase [Stellaceae bacterium]|jgi:ADP-ribose pyrophosphatase|nr:NUDIX hydrolase [Stellaceae bacterium]